MSSGTVPEDIAESESDEVLMGLVAQGQLTRPIALLYARHNPDLYNFIAWLCRGRLQEAEELTQAVWERLMTRGSQYQSQGAFRPYLFQIARRLWLDRQRLDQREAKLPERETLEAMPDSEPTPMDALLDQQALLQLREALLDLPDEQREAIILRFHAELSLEEIGVAVASPVETVKSRLRYAYARLRRVMGVNS